MRAHDFLLEKFNDLPPFRSGRVCEVVDGIAKKVAIRNHILEVYTQASHLSELKRNDEVLFMLTDDGPFIIARRLKHNEKPQTTFQAKDGETISLQFGKSALHISARGEILIQTPNSFISLCPHGNIKMQAENINQKAKKNIKLNAQRHIELNSPQED